MNKLEKQAVSIPDSKMYFLGLCDKFNQPQIAVLNGDQVNRTDLIGLRYIFTTSIFPLPAENFFLVFLIDNNYIVDTEFVMTIRQAETKKEIGSITVKIKALGGGDRLPSRFTMTAAKSPGTYPLPGNYEVLYRQKDSAEILVGGFLLIHTPAPSLTEERVRALKSDPLSAKYIRYHILCNECKDSIKTWVGINGKDDKKDQEGYVWYEDLPDSFLCKCKKVNVDLRYLKGNLHGLLGMKESPFSLAVDIERNYKTSALRQTLQEFEKVINNSKTEEEIQVFIEKNPITLAFLTPVHLKAKAAATAKYKTDFALLNQKGELVLIEIEKSDTPLFTKTGTQHSKLTHAYDQVGNWLREARKNKLGLVDDLSIGGVNIESVTDIKGIVIAGRTLDEYSGHIEKLHARSDILFFTYDDLLKALRNIVLKIEEI